MSIKPKELIDISFVNNSEIDGCMSREGFEASLKNLAFVSNVNRQEEETDTDGIAFICGKTKFFAHLDQEVNTEVEIVKLTDELIYQKGFVISIEKKLSNERFVSNAPEAVVGKERKKMADGLARIQAIQAQLDNLKDR